jgi:hypothetical protein
MRPTLRRIALATVAIVVAWIVEVMLLLFLYAVVRLDPGNLAAVIAAPNTPANGVINALILLAPEYVFARAIYRRMVRRGG